MLIITESIRSIYTEYHHRIFTEGYEQSYHAILEKLFWREKESNTKNDTLYLKAKLLALKKASNGTHGSSCKRLSLAISDIWYYI